MELDPTVVVGFLALLGTVCTVVGGVVVALITTNRGTTKSAQVSNEKTVQELVDEAFEAERVKIIERDNEDLREENHDLRAENQALKAENADLKKGGRP